MQRLPLKLTEEHSRGLSLSVVWPSGYWRTTNRRDGKVQKYVCDVCGYVYDPEAGDPDGDVAAGTAFEDLPDDWVCPECGVDKDSFSPEE